MKLPENIQKAIADYAQTNAKGLPTICESWMNIGAEIALSEAGWVTDPNCLPEIDQVDEWNKGKKISRRVPVYLKGYGVVFGVYHHNEHLQQWQLEGTTGFGAIDAWYDLPSPPKETPQP